MIETTIDGYLDGRVAIKQPTEGYRGGSDAVMLAAAVPVKAGQSVLELGCGVGLVAKCMLWRVPDIDYTAIERVAVFASLAGENLGSGAQVFQADIADLPDPVSQQSFDHVIFNPPYFGSEGRGETALKREAHVEQTPLADWVRVAQRRLKPKAMMTVIHRADRLGDLLALFSGFGDICVLPISARTGQSAKRIIVQARKGTKGPSQLLPPFVMHEGDRHVEDSDDYSKDAQAVLRNGAPIVMKK